MSDELFATAAFAGDSPRLAWMKRHGVITYRTPFEPFDFLAGISGNADMTLDERRDWFAKETAEFGDSRIGIGMTADEAIGEMIKGYSIKLWNEEAP